MVHRLQTALNDLRMKIQTYIFPTKEDEILFFKTQKPEILGRLLFFYKIYKIETQCPNGSDEVIRNYINRELVTNNPIALVQGKTLSLQN